MSEQALPPKRPGTQEDSLDISSLLSGDERFHPEPDESYDHYLDRCAEMLQQYYCDSYTTDLKGTTAAETMEKNPKIWNHLSYMKLPTKEEYEKLQQEGPRKDKCTQDVAQLMDSRCKPRHTNVLVRLRFKLLSAIKRFVTSLDSGLIRKFLNNKIVNPVKHW